MEIRESKEEDWESIWPIFHEIVFTGEAYAYDRNTSKEQGEAIWMLAPRVTFVAEADGKINGTYYLKTNQQGPGNHVCNCGYMVASSARGKGLATLMCEHSQRVAIKLGYKAMQFNFVASTNEIAVRLWSKLGFEIVGELPKAFNHPQEGYINALIMYKWLQS